MRLYFTSHFRRVFKQRCRKNQKLKIKIDRQIDLFQNNISHQSLRVHKLKGERINESAFWIEGNLRIVFVKDKQDLILTDIITHDEY
ncbi:hypothetical protein COW80_01125 [Candidatus Beckwithbacteria bacterium CG22_combo_CG10-13_8_21_14_all_01_47_9]|uniref:Type II toxin-antitoxin system mRNA interferase toxin, RelE/StbE family n=5 Tax=Candidatus Beckwithiibacteriota TaxID=1752726 RepID=A0A2H0E220_9BACT|nr:MAG: hypothetical protein AUJ59_01150 [Candidatus Beckwithbacteria bacterium CG1_02_47_37]PIP52398.1 MAG: hypothetical protein COX09_01805 [Candidatus Beckwithbacteria bacterium CG23_combo_of_CG06-09_8_20_14_all_47_9]PIP88291.1 MAG: hypothetical protein COW80_01125 [Candidatus Beckwithbacteria bacterium CG22_combo_CG10-13_8_21_14_all_01_47_9]PJA21945.1 MAG: hypothetical protein COX59_03590 [Candidatus Beckwithbacteria bacterium CG_4_10_14_0_2_um_filter_47_25]PJC66797.1 MAG: hypothetical prot